LLGVFGVELDGSRVVSVVDVKVDGEGGGCQVLFGLEEGDQRVQKVLIGQTEPAEFFDEFEAFGFYKEVKDNVFGLLVKGWYGGG